jgi:hypothetical protein
MRKIKVFGMNLDGRNRGIVAAHSKKEAARLFGSSLYDFNNNGCETGNAKEIEVATGKPGTVFVKSMNDYSAEYTEK